MPWISAVTEINVVVARMMPSRVRKLRSLFLFKESMAIRPASQNEALGRYFRLADTDTPIDTQLARPLFPDFYYLRGTAPSSSGQRYQPKIGAVCATENLSGRRAREQSV